MKDDLVKQVAIKEIVNPAFELTKQYLKVHSIPKENGIPIIERIDDDSDDGTVIVYFPIEGELYYLAIIIDTEPEVTVRWMNIEAGNAVELVVLSKVLDLDTLVEMAGIEPTQKWKKGEAIKYKDSRINSNRKHEDSGFIYEPNPERADELEDKLDKLLFNLEAKKDNLIKLSKESDVQIEISIAYFGYKSEMWGLHLKPRTIKRIAELNVSVDLDLYAGGPDLTE